MNYGRIALQRPRGPRTTAAGPFDNSPCPLPFRNSCNFLPVGPGPDTPIFPRTTVATIEKFKAEPADATRSCKTRGCNVVTKLPRRPPLDRYRASARDILPQATLFFFSSHSLCFPFFCVSLSSFYFSARSPYFYLVTVLFLFDSDDLYCACNL